MRRQAVWRYVLGTAVVGLLLGVYQNCAQNPDTANQLSSYLESLPFAYKAKIDTIAYMSCSHMDNPGNPRAYFTIRAGAYSAGTGGLTTTDAFRLATQYYTPIDRARAFGQSDLNTNTNLVLSARSRSNLQTPYVANGALVAGQSIDSFLPPLASDDVSGPLASIGSAAYMNYFPGPGDQRLMEASLRFLDNYVNVETDLRNNLQGSGSNPLYLTIAYSDGSDPTQQALRVPPAPTVTGKIITQKNAYGVGYSLGFKSYAASSGYQRLLAPGSITEVDLTTGMAQASTWNCASTMQFKIIRPEDIDAGLVTCGTHPDQATTAQLASLQAIRRVLRVEDWWVDMDSQCVVPKLTGDLCYGPMTGSNQSVDYVGTTCTGNNAEAQSGTPGQYYCPHFVSVCVRQ